MLKKTLVIVMLILTMSVSAKTFKGKITDRQTGEELIGAYVNVKGNNHLCAVSGLDGGFSISVPDEKCTLICSYLGYKTAEIIPQSEIVDFLMDADYTELTEVTVIGKSNGKTETAARDIERHSMNVVNVMSAKAMELSPDLTVGNAIQRMSGVTVERNESGEGQYAILRGMDKRYNYTLVNGVKIPSPDNKNRFVPLDIFPAELLDRLEVHKSLTADLEGDGIGGAINLVMKDAPAYRQLSFNIGTGYNSTFFGNDFNSFSHSKINKKSPNEINGINYPVSSSDFTTENLHVKSSTALPDLNIGASYGDRFFSKRFGVMAAISFQNNYRGKKSSLYYQPGSNFTGITERFYTEQQMRLGAHLKLDYRFNDAHKLSWYNGYIDMTNSQVRDAVNPEWETIRMRWNHQYIFNSTLQGKHSFLPNNDLTLGWSLVWSKAFNETPDNTQIELTTAKTGQQTVSINPGATRRWEHNSDNDKAAYIDLKYHFNALESDWEISAGGMYRDKQRDSYFNEYTFKPAADHRTQIRNTDWQNFDEIIFETTRYGNLSDPLNYDASENIGATFVSAKMVHGKWQIIAGLRAEHTDQGYFLKYPTEGARNEGSQKYWDLLPDVSLKYEAFDKANIHFTYDRAINRPSFFEIVPYNIITEDYKERGNPDLKRTIADNLDLRFEYFPRSSEQFMVGFFYKNIKDPIEYGLRTSGQDTYYMPDNYGTAHNLGVEIDVMKYFNIFGIKANYTYTHSRITTQKTEVVPNPDPTAETTSITRSVDQTRPLAGQAAHVVNLSLLLKENRYKWDAQISGNYTSKRITSVSRYLDNDIWEDGYFKLDASVEKSFGEHISVFLKANNILNSPITRYVKLNAQNQGLVSDKSLQYKNGILERKERNGVTFTIGFRYNL